MADPLRFCMVTTFYPPYHFGGDAVYVYRLSEALARRGHRVDVVHSVDAYRLHHPQEPETAFTHHPNVTLHSLRSLSPWLSATAAHQLGQPAFYQAQLREILQDGRFDVIHYHNVSLVGGPGVLTLGRARKKLYTAHEYWLVCPTHVLFRFGRQACTDRRCLRCVLHSGRPPQLWRRGGYLRRCARDVDLFLMPSRFAMTRHRADGFDAPMEHLPCFVDPPSADAAPPPSGRPYFLYVGRLEALKGVRDLIGLFETHRDADLVIAGSGTLEPELRDRSRHLPHVHFRGQLHPAALSPLYRNAVATLAPSLCYETFGLTVAESLAHGTPAVARRIGALAEIVEDSGGGLTFDTMQECRQAMDRLLHDSEARAEMARRGEEAVRERFTEEAHLALYLEKAASS